MKISPYWIASLVIAPAILNAQIKADPPAAPQPLASTPAAADTPAFTVVEGNGIKQGPNHQAIYDFGTIVQGTTQPVQHDFIWKNNTSEPITVERVQAACGCTTAALDIGEPGSYRPIPPGKELKVHVSVDPGHLFPPHAEKLVWVYVRGSGTPAATMMVTGAVTASVVFDPPVLNFGTVHAGEKRSIPLKVTLDRQSYPGTPDPVSSSPDLTITKDGARTGQALTTQTYSVSLSPGAHIGPIQASLSMPQHKPATQPITGPSAFVSGTILGDITPSPSSIAFGTVSMGHPATQQIILTGVSNDALKRLKIKCASTALKARIVPVASPTLGQPTAELEVTFTPSATGSLQSQVTLQTKSGQVLDLPVWAYVN